MKKWQVVLVTVMALMLLVLSPMTALAQTEGENREGPKPKLEGSLAIVAPRMALVGKEMTLRVFLRENQEPFAGAGVWMLTEEEAQQLKEKMAELREEGKLDKEKDYGSIVDDYGTFLGETGEDGRLSHTFTEVGRYLLVAAEKKYFPDFSPIGVRDIPKALGIEAPRQVPVGEEFTLTVFQKQTQEPVESAGVWALTREEAEELKEAMTALREDTSLPPEEKDYEAVVSAHGAFLGRTDGDGQLTHAFTEPGGYLLVAVKKGYLPGFSPIAVGNVMPQALAIWAPWRAQVDEEVSMTVFQRATHEPIAGAGVWALTRDKIKVLQEETAALREDSSIAPEEKDYEALVSAHGTFLGRTDEEGQLTHTFDEGGVYLLVAAKKGSLPGFTSIFIREITASGTTPEGKAG